ncbi:hypothetical protein IFR04_001275 [Cadophora malorum]|uniref:Major facilitator superfamily (MFS) profile domain-containing protein n=1 Tax=Cadophora malorum TaxID=108018 RepID=A0A8H7WIF6_9HELO|nr:hypothetical protein IFR04_001275 [Cadophora malorum]
MATTLPSPDARHSSTEDVEIAMNDEKHEAMHMEKVESGRNPQVVYEIDEVHQKKVIRKVDLRLLPMLGLMYSISLVDRTNLGLALVAGMQQDLGLAVGDRYTVIVMVFFVAYIIFEIPSNIILPKAGPANWLAFLGVGFGSVLIGMGFVKHWGMMALCRALLGVLEAGFLPGCTYLITCWYTRFEVGKRLAGFWILSVILGGFAAIFAYVLTLLKGREGLNGWQWIFIIEGAITVFVCAIGWFVIVDFPAKAGKFLAPEEKKFMIDRINNDRGDAEEDQVNARRILHHLKDWRLYFWSFNLMASTLPGYAYSYFLPVILKQGMGYSTAQSQLLSAPPYVLAAIMTFTSGWLGDRYHIRGPLIAVHQLLTAVGMLITAYGGSNAARYFGAFLGIGFLQYCIPGVITFQANNITSHSKRAVAAATCMMGGGLGGIFASVAFKQTESPKYTTGIFVTLATSLTSIILVCIMDFYFWRCNKRARAGTHRNEGMSDWYYTY